MSNDSFFWAKWQAYFLENIDISEQKYSKIANKYVESYNHWAFNETINVMKETPYWVMQCGTTKVWLNGWDKSATVAWALAFEYFWDVSGQQKNVFIKSNSCITTNWDVSSVTGTASFTAWTWYGVWASVSVYWKVLFSNDNIIYEYDPNTPTVAPVNKNSTIPFGSKIIHLYFYNDILYVVTRLYRDTIIYSMQYTNTWWTTAYAIYNTDINRWYTCLNAIWDWSSIYWVTSNLIMQFSGWYSQKVATFWWTNNVTSRWQVSTPFVAYWTGFLYVASWVTVYTYGTNKPWRTVFLNSFESLVPVSAITPSYIHWLSGTSNKLYAYSSVYYNTATIITLPYDAWVYWDDKSNLAFRIGYQLPIATYSGTQCSITIWVMTDYMELNNGVNFVTVATISDKTKQRQYVSINEINTALSNAWYSDEWQHIRFKIVLNWWNESSWNMTRTPVYFDIKCTHNNIKDELQ